MVISMYGVVRDRRPGGAVLQQNRQGELEYLTFPSLEETGIVKHLFTTRRGGVSRGIYSTLNLGFTRGDDPAAVRENHRRVGEVLGCAPERMVASHQTHTANIRIVTEGDCGKGIVRERDYENIDGLVTDVPGVCLVTYFADCVPLFFVDPVKGVIGLAHSGWRGTALGMGECMVRALEGHFGCKPEDLRAAVGPSICQECYEVGGETADAFRELAAETEGLREELLEHGVYGDGNRMGSGRRILRPGGMPGKYQLDLWLANALILRQAGIKAEHIAVTDICTCHNPDYLFSHRASQGRRGNLGAFLMLQGGN